MPAPRPSWSDTEATVHLPACPSGACTPAVSEKAPSMRAPSELVLDKQPDPEADAPVTFPDGGWDAWSNVLGCTLISLTALGQVNAFGVFQTYFAQHQLAHMSASDISWIGGVQILLIYLSGVVLGRVFDAYGARGLLASGCVLSTFSLMMLSLCTNFWQILLAQGFGLGLGIALQFYPLLVVPAHWFRQRRAAALGIIVAGSSLGGIVLPILLSRLFARVGFAWGVRAMGFLILGVQALAIPLVRERLPPPRGRPPVDLAAFRDVTFLLHALGGFFTAFGLYTPFWYIELYTLSRGINSMLAFYMIAIMNAAGVFGRVLSGYFADKFGRFNTLVPVAALQAVSCLAVWSTARGTPGTIVFALLFGFASASWSSVATSCVAQITPDAAALGARTGMFMLTLAPGILLGPPIAGALLAAGGGGARGYLAMQCFAGAVLAVGAGFAVAARVVCDRRARVKV